MKPQAGGMAGVVTYFVNCSACGLICSLEYNQSRLASIVALANSKHKDLMPDCEFAILTVYPMTEDNLQRLIDLTSSPKTLH